MAVSWNPWGWRLHSLSEQLLYCLIDLVGKIFLHISNLNLSCFIICCLSFSYHVSLWVKTLALPPWWSPHRCWVVAVRCLQSHLSSRLDKPVLRGKCSKLQPACRLLLNSPQLIILFLLFERIKTGHRTADIVSLLMSKGATPLPSWPHSY